MVGQVVLGKYEIVRLLGEGGMGQVFLGRHAKTGQEVVVKVLQDRLAKQPKFRDMFRREMEFMARFRHPHAVALYEAGVDGPQGPCIVMEYVPGVTLDAMLQQHRRFPPRRVGRWLGQLCSALQHGHNLSIIHRDLKPNNLMLAHPDTAREAVKVMDFGLSQLTSVPHLNLDELRGAAKKVSGTPEYLSPEQSRGDEVDQRSDLYSVGVTLFELLTGRRPFQRETTADYLRAHAYDPPPSFGQVGVLDVPAAIEAVVQRCLCKYAAERPANALELARAYEAALGEPIVVDVPVETMPDLSATPATASGALRIPGAVTYQLEAWMPEKIAVMKLQGFLDTCGGEVTESLPGLVRMRLPRVLPGAAPPASGGLLSWLGLGRKAPGPVVRFVNLDLYMEKKDPGQPNKLCLTLVLQTPDGQLNKDPEAKAYCDKVCGEICGYLIAKKVGP